MSIIERKSNEIAIINRLKHQLYKPYHFTNCSNHMIPQDSTCLNPKCINYCIPTCPKCHFNHPSIQINHIVPKLSLFIRNQWQKIVQEQKLIQNQWSIVLTNIQYCLDILTQLKKQINQRNPKNPLLTFKQILKTIMGMFQHDQYNISPEAMLHNLKRINQKYQIFKSQNDFPNDQKIAQQLKHNKYQVHKASKKTKIFSETALVFSEQLARLMQEKLRQQKRKKIYKQITNKYSFSIKQLMKDQSKLQNCKQILIQIPNQKDQKQYSFIQMFDKCKNLQSVKINNKNGYLKKKNWQQLTYKFEFLSLKQLNLNLKAADVIILGELFKLKQKAVRQVQSLILNVSDEKDINIKQICQLINTMQLRSLTLILARDSLNKLQILELLNGLRLKTSMSNLPLKQFNLNLSKNKVQTNINQIQQIKCQFEYKCKQIKIKQILI